MRYKALALAVVLALFGCDSKKPAPEPAPSKSGSAAKPTAPLTDVTSSLARVREAFNAKKGEARFLTLLSPT